MESPQALPSFTANRTLFGNTGALGSESICFLTVGMVGDAWEGGRKQIDSDPRPSLLLGVAE